MSADSLRNLMITEEHRRWVFDNAQGVSYGIQTNVQNPGRVTTLIHKEDWDAFSSAVSNMAWPQIAMSGLS